MIRGSPCCLCAGDEERAQRVLRRLYAFLEDHLARLIEDADLRLSFMAGRSQHIRWLVLTACGFDRLL
jgi:hypothetical protein